MVVVITCSKSIPAKKNINGSVPIFLFITKSDCIQLGIIELEKSLQIAAFFNNLPMYSQV